MSAPDAKTKDTMEWTSAPDSCGYNYYYYRHLTSTHEPTSGSHQLASDIWTNSCLAWPSLAPANAWHSIIHGSCQPATDVSWRGSLCFGLPLYVLHDELLPCPFFTRGHGIGCPKVGSQKWPNSIRARIVRRHLAHWQHVGLLKLATDIRGPVCTTGAHNTY